MIDIVEADLSLPTHADALIQLMDTYALDPMGGGQGLSNYVKASLTAELAKRKSAHVILAFIDAQPAGLVICLEGFSTLKICPHRKFIIPSWFQLIIATFQKTS
jgi:hypothetical protein